jgi:hypothetical protein
MEKIMTEVENMESILRKVQKLLAIAQDDRANPNEAAAAAGMAERIMRKYQIEHADVIATALKKGDDLTEAEVVGSAKTNGTKVKIVPPWVQFLATRVAKLCEVEVRSARNQDGNACVRFCGFVADVKVAAWMLEYLIATSLRLCNEFKKTEAYKYDGRAAVNSYRLGITTGINASIAALIKAKEVETVSTGRALVVVKKQAIAERFGNFNYGTKKINTSNGNAFASGVVDGKKIDVQRRAIGAGQGGATLRLN